MVPIAQLNNDSETDFEAELADEVAAVEQLDFEPLVATVRQTQRLLGVGKTTVYAMLADGTLERKPVRGATRVTMRSIRAVAGV